MPMPPPMPMPSLQLAAELAVLQQAIIRLLTKRRLETDPVVAEATFGKSRLLCECQKTGRGPPRNLPRVLGFASHLAERESVKAPHEC